MTHVYCIESFSEMKIKKGNVFVTKFIRKRNHIECGQYKTSGQVEKRGSIKIRSSSQIWFDET